MHLGVPRSDSLQMHRPCPRLSKAAIGYFKRLPLVFIMHGPALYLPAVWMYTSRTLHICGAYNSTKLG